MYVKSSSKTLRYLATATLKAEREREGERGREGEGEREREREREKREKYQDLAREKSRPWKAKREEIPVVTAALGVILY